MKAAFEVYQKVIVTVFTTYLILILVFGGSMSVKVNWDSWSQLIEHFKHKHERLESKK